MNDQNRPYDWAAASAAARAELEAKRAKEEARRRIQARISMMVSCPQDQQDHAPSSSSCLERLCQMKAESFFQPGVMAAFRALFSRAENERFNEAEKSLNLLSLSEREQHFFWFLCCHFAQRGSNPVSPGDLMPIFESPTEVAKVASGSIKLGLVTRTEVFGDNAKPVAAGYLISLRVAKTLFCGNDTATNYEGISRYATVISSSAIIEKPLFFSARERGQIELIHSILQGDAFADVQARLVGRKRNPAVQILIWGPPGTGKTEVAKQIARSCGRDLIQLNAANMIYPEWGAAEKSYQSVFREYNYLAVTSSRTPILFLNEADNLLSHRLKNLDRAIDKGENTLTTILLQAFEDMNGILIATTNYADLLDEAFDRRFLFKLELGVPDVQVREQIWHNALPMISAADAHTLASEFALSGSQIENVAAKYDIIGALSGEPCMCMLRQLCQEEQGSRARHCKIGFI